MLIAGGTDLLPNMKRRQMAPKILVSLRGIFGAEGNGSASRRGPRRSPQIVNTKELPLGLRQAAHQVATVHLRNMGTLGGNLCLDTRCNYYNQNYEWRKAIDFCLKKDGDICWVATASKRCVAASSTDCAPALIALGAQGKAVSPSEDEREVAARGPLQQRRHRLSDAPAGRDPYGGRNSESGERALTGSCAAAARSISRCSVSARRDDVNGGGARSRSARWRRGRSWWRRRTNSSRARSSPTRSSRKRRSWSPPAPSPWTTPTWTSTGARTSRAEFACYALRELRGDDMRATRLRIARQVL